MASATGVCQHDVHHGAVDAEICMEDLVHDPEALPALHAEEGGKVDSLFDQLMKEAQASKRKPQTSTHPAFVAGRITRDAVDALVGGCTGLVRHLAWGMSAVNKALQVGPSGPWAQEDLRSEPDVRADGEQSRGEQRDPRGEALEAILAAAEEAKKWNEHASSLHARLDMNDLSNKKAKARPSPVAAPDQPSTEARQERDAGQAAKSDQAPSEAQTCEAGGDCMKGRDLHWKLDAPTPEAFWARAAERGWNKESFKGKAIVFIEPERDASAAMKLAASVRWKEGDRILDMLDPWSLEEAKKAGFDICETPHSLPGKGCIGIADPVIVKRRADQIVRLVEALKTAIKMLARVLPQDELWMSRHRAVSKTAAHELAALFGSQVEAVNKMLETHLIKQADADALHKVRSDIIRESEALNWISAETFPDMIRYAWEQLEQHRASRAGTDRTDLIVLGPDAGRSFIAENRDKDVVIVELQGQRQRQSDSESALPDMGVPPFREMRIAESEGEARN